MVSLQTAERLARYLARELDLDERKADSLRFGAEIVFSTTLGLVFIAVAGYLLGCLAEALAAAGACALVRSCAGGAHCSTAWRCAVVSGAVFPSLGRAAGAIPLYPGGWEPYGAVLAASTASVYLILKLAPVDNPVKPIEDSARRARLKLYSLFSALAVTVTLLLALWFNAPHSLVLAGVFGLVWSALVLTRPVHGLMALADKAMGGWGKWFRLSTSQSA